MRDPAEATVLMTGATDGLGKCVALELARRGATVPLHGRSRERCEMVLEEVRRQTGRSEGSPYYLADLSSLCEVRGLAEQILSEHDRLHVLVNNAGVIARERKETEDGYELTFAVNYLAHFLLTNLLLSLLRDSAPARVVNVTSAGQSPMDFDDVLLESLNPFDTILLRTHNSDYHILLLDPKTGRALVEGGEYLVEPNEALLRGSAIPGCEFKGGWICAGSRLEIWVDERVLLTSTIKSVHVKHNSAAAPVEDISAALH